MPAGDSARHEARRARARAEEFERRRRAELRRAAHFDKGGRAEQRLATTLRALGADGWQLLEDRRWPNSRANIDLILLGPGGVFVLDVKDWSEPSVVDGRLYRGEADAQDDLDSLERICDLVTDVCVGEGLAPGEVHPALVFTGRRCDGVALGRCRLFDEHSLISWLVGHGPRLGEDDVVALTKAVDAAFPPCEQPAPAVPAVIAEPVLPLGRHAAPVAPDDIDLDALTSAYLDQLRALPIEEWMAFLHPDQSRLVRRPLTGASRIRGAAGTGKTIVALHRAAYLAESTAGPLLFTTFVKTVPPVMQSLYRRLSPSTAERVEFVNLHRWANQLIKQRGHTEQYDRRQVERAYRIAWGMHGKGTALASLGVSWEYWRDEITHVIKGRGITDFADYAALNRVGRRTALQPSHRELVWNVYAEYEARLREFGVIDFCDQIDLALGEITASPLETPYAAVIADEVQDLSCQAIRLLKALSGGGERLLLVGDGQQQIYPGGYTLAEAGLSVAGRSTVLRTNYRNASEIMTAARDALGDAPFNDLEGALVTAAETAVARTGGRVVRRHGSAGDLEDAVLHHVRSLISSGQRAEGIAVLCSTNAAVNASVARLRAAGLPAVNLRDYTGTAVDAVKVGTVERAKGLEFTHVAVMAPRIDRSTAPEDAERTRMRRYVAMTRARDSLWIGTLA